MDRREIYAQIKELGLAEEVKKKFGKNFTQVSTVTLVSLIEKSKVKKVDSKKVKTGEDTKKVTETVVNYKAKYDTLVTAVAKFLALIPEDVINDISAVSTTLKPEKIIEDIEFSNADIDKMFK